jgi:hypothetical protein
MMNSSAEEMPAPWLIRLAGAEAARRLPVLLVAAIGDAYRRGQEVRRSARDVDDNVVEGVVRWKALNHRLSEAVAPALPGVHPHIAAKGPFVLVLPSGAWVYPVKYGDDERPTIEHVRITAEAITERLERHASGTPLPGFDDLLPVVDPTVIVLAYTGTPAGELRAARFGLGSLDQDGRFIWAAEHIDLDVSSAAPQEEGEHLRRAVGDSQQSRGFLAGAEPEVDLGLHDEEPDGN